MRLTRQFAIAGALAAIVPLLVYGAISLRALRQGTRQSVTQGMVSLTDRTADQIDDWVIRTTAQVVGLAAQLDGTRLERWQQERALRNWTLAFPEFRELALFDETGTAVVSTRLTLDKLHTPLLDRPGQLGARLSPLAIDDDLLPTFHIGVQMEIAPGEQGLLVGTMNLERIWRVVDDLRIGQHGYAMLSTIEVSSSRTAIPIARAPSCEASGWSRTRSSWPPGARRARRWSPSSTWTPRACRASPPPRASVRPTGC